MKLQISILVAATLSALNAAQAGYQYNCHAAKRLHGPGFRDPYVFYEHPNDNTGGVLNLKCTVIGPADFSVDDFWPPNQGHDVNWLHVSTKVCYSPSGNKLPAEANGYIRGWVVQGDNNGPVLKCDPWQYRRYQQGSHYQGLGAAN